MWLPERESGPCVANGVAKPPDNAKRPTALPLGEQNGGALGLVDDATR
jgi:hypothetical protein